MSDQKTILFICKHNGGRSPMAEAFLNRIAKERGLPVRALSAGTEPREDLNPVVREAMAEIGVPMVGQRPKPLTQKLADRADRIITMGRGVDVAPCLERPMDVEDWGMSDPMGKTIEGVRQVRDQVKAKVQALVEELAADLETIATKEGIR